jgi:hypothetical protein
VSEDTYILTDMIFSPRMSYGCRLRHGGELDRLGIVRKKGGSGALAFGQRS